MRGIWDRGTMALLVLVALLPLTVVWLRAEGASALLGLMAAAALVAAWQAVFFVLRAQPPCLWGLVPALAVAMLAPQEMPPLHWALGLSFGVVVAEQVFGGWGRNVLHPGTVALAFLAFGFPAAPWPDLPVQLGWAALACAGLGAVLGVMPVAVLLAAGAGLGALAAWADLPATLWPETLWPAALVCLVLLVADPVAGAATQAGRIAAGALYPALLLLFVRGWTGADPVQLSVSAALLVGLAAPLFDEIAIALWSARRRARLG